MYVNFSLVKFNSTNHCFFELKTKAVLPMEKNELYIPWHYSWWDEWPYFTLVSF